MSFEFVDFATKAKELGLTESTFRARVLNHYEELPCFIYLPWTYARGTQENFLPPRIEGNFPFVNWDDVGCRIDISGYSDDDRAEWRRPRYGINGWVAIGPDLFGELFFNGQIMINASWVHIVSSNLMEIYTVQLDIKPDKEWVESKGYEEGGYYREISKLVTKDAIYWLSGASTESKSLGPRKQKSYLSIIAAMRALLMDKDGGGFPSQAKVIDELEARYGAADGLSKRNLEMVFSEATRAAGEALKPKV